ncbi:MAG: hypothetical protein KTR24_06440 [Saprospiraceae bacterium]|nr:hypothetical protein [Saprospiraceae bacterium]
MAKRKILLLQLAVWWLVVPSSGQSSIQEPAALSRMIQQYTFKNKEVTTTKAWTIQVAVSTDRREVERERGRFGRIFPQHRLEWVHDDPYYLLKMKDIAFVQKRDALHLLHEIKDRYRSSAILVLEDVPPEKLLQSL